MIRRRPQKRMMAGNVFSLSAGRAQGVVNSEKPDLATRLPQIRFLFVGSEVCSTLPSDSVSRTARTPA